MRMSKMTKGVKGSGSSLRQDQRLSCRIESLCNCYTFSFLFEEGGNRDTNECRSGVGGRGAQYLNELKRGRCEKEWSLHGP